LYQVLLESGNLAFALIYRIENNTIVDFYQDEDLSQSINLISSFEDELAEESFKLKYDDMMRSLYEAEKKYY
jgi:hypothetical protein